MNAECFHEREKAKIIINIMYLYILSYFILQIYVYLMTISYITEVIHFILLSLNSILLTISVHMSFGMNDKIQRNNDIMALYNTQHLVRYNAFNKFTKPILSLYFCVRFGRTDSKPLNTLLAYLIITSFNFCCLHFCSEPET